MTRQSGYYWVKFRGIWGIGKYYHNETQRYCSWRFSSCNGGHSDDELDQINETRILAPDEVSDERVD